MRNREIGGRCRGVASSVCVPPDPTAQIRSRCHHRSRRVPQCRVRQHCLARGGCRKEQIALGGKRRLDPTRRSCSGITIISAEDHGVRSEEHTSELQSRQNRVCRLLLEKKKKKKKTQSARQHDKQTDYHTHREANT